MGAAAHHRIALRQRQLLHRCSTAAIIRSRTSSPLMPPVVARKLMASRSQQSSAKATRTRSPLSQLRDGVHPPIAIGRQLGDDRFDLSHELIVRQRWPTDPLLRSRPQALDEVGTGNSNRLCYGLHREPFFGGDGGSRSCFFEPVACLSASLRISASGEARKPGSARLGNPRPERPLHHCRLRSGRLALPSGAT